MFNPFANKIQFESFVVDSSKPCACGCSQVLISPTNNTHAASARCPGSRMGLGADLGLGCGKFHRWLGKQELKDLLAAQHQHAQKVHEQPVAEGSPQQAMGTTKLVSLDSQQAKATK